MQPAIPDARILPVVAVLPFDGFGGAETCAWSDALTGDIVDTLAHLHDIRVVARTSAMRFEDARKDVHEIASVLSANVLIEGSLQREGNQLRVIAQIVAANDDGTFGQTPSLALQARASIFSIQCAR